MSTVPALADYREQLLTKIKTLHETIWEHRLPEARINAWLGNFGNDGTDPVTERTHAHALHLLSQFMYFGNKELRALLVALFRDLFRYPVIQDLRAARNGTLDGAAINDAFLRELRATRH